MAMLPDGERFLSCGSYDGQVKLYALDGTLLRTIDVGLFYCSTGIAVLPDSAHFVVACHIKQEVRLFNVDGTLVDTFSAETNERNAGMGALAVTRDGEHIIGGTYDALVRVWNVATKGLVCTCRGLHSMVTAVAYCGEAPLG